MKKQRHYIVSWIQPGVLVLDGEAYRRFPSDEDFIPEPYARSLQTCGLVKIQRQQEHVPAVKGSANGDDLPEPG